MEDIEVQVLAGSATEAEAFERIAEMFGVKVGGSVIWEGSVPPNSFVYNAPHERMSTPEYFFFRKANEYPFAKAVALGLELCGKHMTRLTSIYVGEDEYCFNIETPSSRNKIYEYLKGAYGMPEERMARKVLSKVLDNCSTPMCGYIYEALCLPRKYGGYGLPRPSALSVAFKYDEVGFCPSAESAFLAYDIVWEDERVAIQYVGDSELDDEETAQLENNAYTCVQVTNADVDDGLGEVADKVGWLLGKKPRKTHELELEIPRYENMRMTTPEIFSHV